MKRITSLTISIALVAAAGALMAGHPAWAEQPRDAWITMKVKMALLTDDHVDAVDIDVDTSDGHVTLHGQVASDDLQQRAAALASKVDGVREVRNLLAVVPEAAEEHVEASDDALRERLETVLDRDSALSKSDIRVKSVHDGVVVLSGEADTLSAHRRALEDARSVEGVRRVASEIRSPDALADREIWREAGSAEPSLADAASDTWITTRAKLLLMTEPGLSPLAVNVDTRHGVVTLFGSVDSEEKREAAEKQVSGISGVKGVENALQVVPDVAAARVERQDDQIALAVRERLEARPALRDDEIDVEVSDAVVRLTGTVSGFDDKMQALTVARSTEGVASIVDGLRVQTNEEGRIDEK